MRLSLVVSEDLASCERFVLLMTLINSGLSVGRALISPSTPPMAGEEAMAMASLRVKTKIKEYHVHGKGML